MSSIPASGADIIAAGSRIAVGEVTLTPNASPDGGWAAVQIAHGLGVRPRYVSCVIVNSGTGWWRAQAHAIALNSLGQWLYNSTVLTITAQTVDGSPAAAVGTLTVRWLAVA